MLIRIYVKMLIYLKSKSTLVYNLLTLGRRKLDEFLHEDVLYHSGS